MFRKMIAAFVAALALVAVLTASTTAQQDPSAATTPQTTATARERPYVVRTTHTLPKFRVVRHRKFTPWATPTVAQVQTIINYEAARAGISAGGLSHRIACESGYRWWAANGQYHGLGQFAYSTFARGMSTIGSREVRFVSDRVRVRWVLRHRLMSDGRVITQRAWQRHQHVVTVERGVIPRYPAWTHGWAQVRIMAQAIAGRSAVSNSEWSCGL